MDKRTLNLTSLSEAIIRVNSKGPPLFRKSYPSKLMKLDFITARAIILPPRSLTVPKRSQRKAHFFSKGDQYSFETA